jgi:hypothetical protein
MDRSEVAPTLLSALLRNQIAIAEALQHLASMAESNGHETVAAAVRDRLQVLEQSQSVVGACVGALMQT